MYKRVVGRFMYSSWSGKFSGTLLAGVILLWSGEIAPAANSPDVAPTQSSSSNRDAGKPPVNRPVKDKWALVIGISNFQDSKLNLKYAAKDATDFANFLIKDENFAADHVQVLTDEKATRANVLSLLGDRWLPHVAKPG
jgi:hypothetical protein